MDIREGLTFDDVLLEPGPSDVMPTQVDTRTKFTREHQSEHPAGLVGHGHGDRSRLAVAMAQAGGMGIVTAT